MAPNKFPKCGVPVLCIPVSIVDILFFFTAIFFYRRVCKVTAELFEIFIFYANFLPRSQSHFKLYDFFSYKLFTTLRIPFFNKISLKFMSKPNLNFPSFK